MKNSIWKELQWVPKKRYRRPNSISGLLSARGRNSQKQGIYYLTYTNNVSTPPGVTIAVLFFWFTCKIKIHVNLVKRLLLDLDSYGGTDPLGMFLFWRGRQLWLWYFYFSNHSCGSRLAVVFRRLLRLGSFPVCWRVTNVTPIPKGPPSSSAWNYKPISLTPILS